MFILCIVRFFVKRLPVLQTFDSLFCRHLTPYFAGISLPILQMVANSAAIFWCLEEVLSSIDTWMHMTGH